MPYLRARIDTPMILQTWISAVEYLAFIELDARGTCIPLNLSRGKSEFKACGP
jgi:hypothetical protein